MATSNGLFEADDEMPASILSSNLQERVQARRERLQRRLENIRRYKANTFYNNRKIFTYKNWIAD